MMWICVIFFVSVRDSHSELIYQKPYAIEGKAEETLYSLIPKTTYLKFTINKYEFRPFGNWYTFAKVFKNTTLSRKYSEDEVATALQRISNGKASEEKPAVFFKITIRSHVTRPSKKTAIEINSFNSGYSTENEVTLKISDKESKKPMLNIKCILGPEKMTVIKPSTFYQRFEEKNVPKTAVLLNPAIDIKQPQSIRYHVYMYLVDGKNRKTTEDDVDEVIHEVMKYIIKIYHEQIPVGYFDITEDKRSLEYEDPVFWKTIKFYLKTINSKTVEIDILRCVTSIVKNPHQFLTRPAYRSFNNFEISGNQKSSDDHIQKLFENSFNKLRQAHLKEIEVNKGDIKLDSMSRFHDKFVKLMKENFKEYRKYTKNNKDFHEYINSYDVQMKHNLRKPTLKEEKAFAKGEFKNGTVNLGYVTDCVK